MISGGRIFGGYGLAEERILGLGSCLRLRRSGRGMGRHWRKEGLAGEGLAATSCRRFRECGQPGR